jgi:hypothetical protein
LLEFFALHLTLLLFCFRFTSVRLSFGEEIYAPFSVDSDGHASERESRFTDERDEPRDWRRLSRALHLGPVMDRVENDGELLGLAGLVPPGRRVCSRWLLLDRRG